MSVKTSNQILSAQQVNDKITRMAYEIYENNYEEEEIVLVGINGQGFVLAELLQEKLKAISDVPVLLGEMKINKDDHLSEPISVNLEEAHLKGRAIVLIDDVQNSGRTISHGLGYLLMNRVKKIETAVLVDRSHKSFPILANFMGYEIATMIDEYISVQLRDEVGVYLHS